MIEMTMLHWLMILGVSSVITFFIGYVIRKVLAEGKLENAEKVAKKIIADAQKETGSIKREATVFAKDELHKTRAEFERESKDRKQELTGLEKRILQKEENLDRKVELIEKKDNEINARDRELKNKEQRINDKIAELDSCIRKEMDNLMKITGLNKEEAKKMLLSRLEDEVRHEAASMLKQIEIETKDSADKKAKEIISSAIQRCAADHTSETTISTVALPSDEMKGRIIGREGRNIRALEAATGIDIIIDDTPEAVILSGFDAVRKEIAKNALEKLIVDGRIHPTRIEEVVAKAKKEIAQVIKDAGEQASFDTGVHGLHPEVIKLLGRLRFRTSYGQNVLNHSREVSYLMGVMASELGQDVQLAKRAGLLHDLGKAADHDIEGSHAVIGGDLAKKYGEGDLVINAIKSHHNDEEPQSVIATLVAAADAISGSRPGARSETLEAYIKRLGELERIANSFKGVDKTYAIQAGREIRVIVIPDKVDDNEAVFIARNITKKIQDELDYPGQIKVTVIRETRAIEYAK
ncbi:MAG: ribonuclease Y [Candidatus Ancaeobacter aquaticus]|nr:ribonuclease Y [Candidatus Ancaeobacter aquaticus]